MPTFKRKLFCNLLSKLNVNWSNKSCIQKKPSKKKTSRGWNMLKQPASTHTHRWSHVDPIGVAFMRKVFGTSFGIAWPKENHQLPISRVCCWNTLTLKPKKEQALEILWLHMMYSRGRTTQISTFIDLFKNTLCFRPALSIEEQMELALWLDVETFPFFVHPQNFKRKSGKRHLR